MARYQIEAYNTATKSENKMHDDTVAKQFGFRGGLVPGVDVFAYLTRAPAERWGRDWLDRGVIDARFHAPVYDGDLVMVESSEGGPSDGETPNGGGLSMALMLTDSDGAMCASGRAGLPDAAPAAPGVEAIGVARVPDPRPPASEEALAAFAGGVLGTLDYGFHADLAPEYLKDVRDTLPLYTDERVAHPGWLLRMANYALSHNVRLGPWIHVESRMQFHGAVTDGDHLSVRSRVTRLTERKGHRFVDLDVFFVVNDDRVAATVAHTAIYEPRGAKS
jgi:acyl dehydratase